MRLFFKECTAISKSIIYFVFVIVVVLFFVTQFDTATTQEIGQAETGTNSERMPVIQNAIAKPDPRSQETGYQNAENPKQVMPQATALLAMEYLLNDTESVELKPGEYTANENTMTPNEGSSDLSTAYRITKGYFMPHPEKYISTGDGYTGYPYGFFKITKLSPEKQIEIAKVIKTISGLTPEEILDRITENNLHAPMPGINMLGEFGDEGDYSKVIPILVDYDVFKNEMEKVRKLVGRGSCYSEREMEKFGCEPLTFETRLAQYNEIMEDDQITNAYARLFCDYMGIVAGLFAVFVPVSFLLRDRRSRMSELVYVRGVSSLKIIGCRFFASAFMCFLPIIILSFFPLVQLASFGARQGIGVDYFAFIKYACAWVLPTILTVTGVAFILTILTETSVAIFVQLAWSIIAVFSTALNGLAGDSGFALIIRHNLVGGLSDVREQLGALTINRISYSIFALLLMFGSVEILNLKRKGQLSIRRKRG
jgi:hypothetical protein